MEIYQVFYNTFSRRGFFEMTNGQRPWDVFLVITEGSFSFTLDGETFTVEENEIAYFPMNKYFERQVTSPISFHQFAFNTDPSHPYYAKLKAGKLSIPKKDVRRIIKDLECLLHLPDIKDLHSHYIEHMIVQNYIHKRQHDISPKGYPESIVTVIQYMNEHLDEKIDVDVLADLVHMSHVGLLKKFKQHTGHTLAHYLIMRRMSLAKQLLLENTLRVNEIALRCGYANSYYFSNAFREYYKVSPRKFREIMLGEQTNKKFEHTHYRENTQNNRSTESK